MLLAFGAVTALQVVITQFGGAAFGTAPLSPSSWAKVIAVSSTILFISEASKAAYRVYLRFSGKIAPPKLSALRAKR
ncbi:MAG: cation transporting ATPase C-terminal domain-containing protein [Clostridia bacterium]|nr:cation transporting ATPase C-terminal domain-containing protein [Clostridia bacterium]